jgi:hypothetical protein
MSRRLADWLGVVAAIGMIVGALVGCGAVPASPVRATINVPSGKVEPALCRKPWDAAQARVTQVGGQPARAEASASQHDWPGPSGVVSGPAAQSLARAVCSLPGMPSGTFHCPVLLFEVYRVVFIAFGTELRPVIVQATGCRRVTGLGRVRWAVRSDALLEELARIATGTQYFGPATRDPS